MRPIQKLRAYVQMFVALLRCSRKDHSSVSYFALLKPGYNRTKLEHIAVTRLLLRFKYFNDLQNQIGQKRFLEFSMEVEQITYHATDVLIHQGEMGRGLFIVLEGKVGVWIHSAKTREGRRQILQQQLALAEKKDNPVPDYENGEHFETLEVAQLGVGAVLGDLSMLDNTITSASVKAIMTCRIGFINKENFLKYVSRDKWKEMETLLKVLSKLPFLAGWTKSDLKSFSYHFKPIKLVRNQVLFQQVGQKVEGLHLISEGEIQLSKQHTIVLQQPMLLKERPRKLETVISILSAPESLYECNPKHGYTARCVSQDAEILFVSQEDLDRRLNWHQNSQSAMQQFVLTRTIWRQQRSELAAEKPEPDLERFLVVSRSNAKQTKRYGVVSSFVSTPKHLDMISATEDLDQSFTPLNLRLKPRSTKSNRPKTLFISPVNMSFREKQLQRRAQEAKFRRSLELLLGKQREVVQPEGFNFAARHCKTESQDYVEKRLVKTSCTIRKHHNSMLTQTSLSSQGMRTITTAQTMKSSFFTLCKNSMRQDQTMKH